jgi:hypothetical protein
VPRAASPTSSASSHESAERPPRPSRWIPLAALVVTVFAACHAWTKGPYSQHVDEHYLLGASHKMLQSGDFDPGWYRYGSVSIHLCALGEALGYLDHSRNGSWKPVSELSKSVVPLTRPSRLGSWPRLLFALLGGVSLLLAGLSADRLRPRSGAGLVTILLLASHVALQEQWFGYLNVDIIAAFFAMSAIWAHLSAERGASWLRACALPAALWGMAAATKYPMGVGVLSVALAELFGRNRISVTRAVASLGVALLAFLVAMPFALTNSPVFLSDLAFELNHYAKGHSGFASEPGLDVAWHHLKAWLLPLGPAAAATLIGVYAAAKRTPRGLITLLGPGVLLLALLALQSTNFTRNSLLFGYLLSCLAGVGLAASYPWLLERVGRLKIPLFRRSWALRSAVLLALFAVSFGTRGPALAQLASGHQESRDDLQVRLAMLPQNSLVASPHSDFMSSASVQLVLYDPTGLPAEALAQLIHSQATHAVVPRKWARSRFRGEEPTRRALANARAFHIPGKPMWRGGVDEVWVHWPFHPRGNPDVELVAIDRAQLSARLRELGQ